MQALAEPRNSTDHDIPGSAPQGALARAMASKLRESRRVAIPSAHASSAEHERDREELALSVSRVSPLIARAEEVKARPAPVEGPPLRDTDCGRGNQQDRQQRERLNKNTFYWGIA